MIYGYNYEPLRNRVPQWIDRRWQIQGYGEDNLYPQRAKAVRDASATTKSACSRYAEFINGEGFTNPVFGSTIVNRKGHTANDFLDHIAESLSWANGFFIHVGYNLNYKVNSVKVVPFEFNRFGIPDECGEFDIIRYSTNWEQNPYKNINGTMTIDNYPLFNPNPDVVKEQIARAGGILNYSGQIFFWSPDEGQYPKSVFDSVFDQAQTETEIAIFDLAMEQNGFKAGHAIAYPGKFESKQEEQKFKDGINDFTGRGAGSALVFENPDGNLKINEMIVPLQMQNTDSLHVNVDKRVRGAIRRAFGMPAEIIGELPDSGMFNQQQMQDAYLYYNALTRNARNVVSRQVKKIFDHWQTPLTDDYSIIPQQYTQGQVTAGANG